METVGSRIRAIRNELHLTQVELSKRSGVSQSAISDIEKGVKSPSVETLQMIAEALGRSPADFVTNKKEAATSNGDSLRNEVIYLYDNLSEPSRDKVLSYLRYVSDNEDKK